MINIDLIGFVQIATFETLIKPILLYVELIDYFEGKGC